jgi:ribosomal protein L3
VFSALVRLSQRWQVEATGLKMSDLIEIIYPQSMTAKLLQNGEVIAEYKVEQCDSCAKVKKLDAFGYTKGQGGQKLTWLCGDCR